MKLKELLKDIEFVELTASPDAEIGGISYDSRKTKPNDAFVAIAGYAFDGHAYIRSAAENGAAVIICERKPQIDIPYVMVKDCRYALALLPAGRDEAEFLADGKSLSGCGEEAGISPGLFLPDADQ